MRFWPSAASAVALLLGACVGPADPAAGRLAIRSATVEARSGGAQLNARLDLRPSAIMLEALEHGIALDLRVTLMAEGAARLGWHAQLGELHRHLQLRYFPLSRQYQLVDLDRAETRSFAVRAALLDALDDLRLALPAAAWQQPPPARYRLNIALDHAALPGALRLPALFDPAWQLRTEELAWAPAAVR